MSSASGDVPSTPVEIVRCFFRHGSPRILALTLIGCLYARFQFLEVSWVDLVIVVFVTAFWPIQEWLIHVFILHFRPIKVLGRDFDLLVAAKHREHHKDPWKIDLVFVPLHVYLGGPVFIAAVLFLAPKPVWALTYLSIFFLLGLHYEWVHLLVHTRYRPRSWWYDRLWKHHRLHHFKNENYWYGVTMLSGDWFLKTAPVKDDVPTSPTARDLLGNDGTRA